MTKEELKESAIEIKDIDTLNIVAEWAIGLGYKWYKNDHQYGIDKIKQDGCVNLLFYRDYDLVTTGSSINTLLNNGYTLINRDDLLRIINQDYTPVSEPEAPKPEITLSQNTLNLLAQLDDLI